MFEKYSDHSLYGYIVMMESHVSASTTEAGKERYTEKLNEARFELSERESKTHVSHVVSKPVVTMIDSVVHEEK